MSTKHRSESLLGKLEELVHLDPAGMAEVLASGTEEVADPRLRAHLARCATCRAEVQELRDALSEYREVAPAPNDSVVELGNQRYRLRPLSSERGIFVVEGLTLLTLLSVHEQGAAGDDSFSVRQSGDEQHVPLSKYELVEDRAAPRLGLAAQERNRPQPRPAGRMRSILRPRDRAGWGFSIDSDTGQVYMLRDAERPEP